MERVSACGPCGLFVLGRSGWGDGGRLRAMVLYKHIGKGGGGGGRG